MLSLWNFFLFSVFYSEDDYKPVYSSAHPNCYGFPCDSVIYIRFPNQTKHKNYGGYYVIDGIEERKCGDDDRYAYVCKTWENLGFSLTTDFSAGIPRYMICL